LVLASGLPASATAQTPAGTVTLHAKDISVGEALAQIERQSGYIFFYHDEALDVTRKVSLNVEAQPVERVLDRIFASTGNTWRIAERQIFISPPPPPKPAAPAAPFQVTGRVTNPAGDPLAGVSVVAAEAMKGTVSDYQGRFSLELTGAATLEFSLLGFVKQTVRVNSATTLDVTLAEQATELDDVVVLGYGTLSKSNVSSSIGTYRPSTLSATSAVSADRLLQGRISGVHITSASGALGGSSRVSVRGIGSLSASNEPLYVIDGVLLGTSSADLGNFGESMSPLATLNPQDIESIEVLKDAASAAIYGSRATNGVILVTTKSGSKGKKAVVSVGLTMGLSQAVRTDKVEMAPSELYLEVLNEAIDNYNLQTGLSEPRIDMPFPGRADTDWLGLVLQTGRNINANLSVAGGTEATSYYVSGNVGFTEGIFTDNRLDKYNIKANVHTDANSWFSVGTNINLNYTRNNRVPSGYSIGTNMFPRALEQRPWDRPYNPDGSYTTNSAPLLNHNPLQAIKEENVWLDNYKVLGNIFAEARLAKGLALKTSFGGEVGYTEEHIYYNKKHTYGNGLGRLTDGRRLQTNMLVETSLSYRESFVDDALFFDIVAGHAYQKEQTSLSNIVGVGFPSDSFDVMTAAATINEAITNLYGTAIQSFFSRASLSWKQRYLLTLSIRADGSSRFAPESRYGYFPSVSAGWNISEEEFWKHDKTRIKLRASYGATGNQSGIGGYAYQALTSGGYNYNGLNGIAIASEGNRDLTWEKARQFDVGVDVSLFRGMLSFEADYFIKNTTNLLYSLPVHSTTGFTSIPSNIGSMRNRGFEFAVHGNVGRKVKWQSDFNISFIRNRLTSLIDDSARTVGTLGVNVLQVGHPVGSFYMVKHTGIYQYDEEVPEVLYAKGVRAGDCIYEDITGEGDISAGDKQVVGSANPKFSGGFNNTITWNGFDLSMFLTFSYGNMVYEGWTGGYRLGSGSWPMLRSQAEGRWTGPGTSNTIPRAIYGLTHNSTAFPSTRYLHDASYIRCRNLTLGYSLPRELVARAGISNVRVYFQVDNLFLLTRFPMLDPEVNISLAANAMGQDFLLPPQPRSFNFGVNLQF
jgi:TonB-linked SusC/RagA family outer membrane protein